VTVSISTGVGALVMAFLQARTMNFFIFCAFMAAIINWFLKSSDTWMNGQFYHRVRLTLSYSLLEPILPDRLTII